MKINKLGNLIDITDDNSSRIKLPSIKLIAGDLKFPEGPAFADDGSLWAVELKVNSLVRVAHGSLQKFEIDGAPNGIAIAKDGLIWFCDSGKNMVRTFDFRSGVTQNIVTNVDEHTLAMPNDLAFDDLGNLVFTCPGNSRKEPTGYACVRTQSGIVKKIIEGMYFPNGVAFTPDGKELIMAETYRHRLWKGTWNPYSGEWLNAGPWCDVGGPDGPGGPDGMAFHSNGNLYVAVYGTGRIKVVNPQGRIISEIVLPGNNPTNCAIDPSGKLGLVVTEAEYGDLLSVKPDQQ